MYSKLTCTQILGSTQTLSTSQQFFQMDFLAKTENSIANLS